MPFCPKCGYEYEVGVIKCADCGVELVDQLPSAPEPKEEEWVLLRTLPGRAYAEMAKEALNHAGIPASIKPGALAGSLLVAGTDGECSLIVPKRRKKQAEKILNDMMDHI
ncbi:MAG: hypothetical protein ONB12_12160 [candidate division KSB1 bacterium]|nr:hypothetical protein [candidate division KSB1 bacterium]